MMRDVEEDVLLRWLRRAWRSNPPGPAPAMITRRVSMDVFGRHMFFLLLYCVPSWFIMFKRWSWPRRYVVTLGGGQADESSLRSVFASFASVLRLQDPGCDRSSVTGSVTEVALTIFGDITRKLTAVENAKRYS